MNITYIFVGRELLQTRDISHFYRVIEEIYRPFTLHWYWFIPSEKTYNTNGC